MGDLDEKVYNEICKWQCGNVFEKPDSCEICLDDFNMNALRDYELKKARKQGKDYFNN